MFETTIAERVRPLAAALREAGIARLKVSEEGFELELRRAPRAEASPAAAPGAEPAATPENGARRTADLVVSDVVGIVRFARPTPVEGTFLDGDRDLGYVEALGVRNPVRSRGAGRIASILVAEGQPVEYGQPLFAIER